MNILLPIFIAGLIASTAVWIAVFRQTKPAPADWGEDWPEWLNNVVCILPASEGSAG